jgi:hypothetical protein
LKFAFTDLSRDVLVWFMVPLARNIFFHPFISSLCLSLPVRYVSYSQQMVLIQSISMCFFTCRLESINIKSYYWKVMFDYCLVLVCLSIFLVRFILLHILIIVFIFLFCL